MKASLFTVPIVIAAFLLVAVWGLGMLAVKASAVSTQTSLELLRLHLRVTRLHDELQARSRERLVADGLMAYPGASPAPGQARREAAGRGEEHP